MFGYAFRWSGWSRKAQDSDCAPVAETQHFMCGEPLGTSQGIPACEYMGRMKEVEPIEAKIAVVTYRENGNIREWKELRHVGDTLKAVRANFERRFPRCEIIEVKWEGSNATEESVMQETHAPITRIKIAVTKEFSEDWWATSYFCPSCGKMNVMSDYTPHKTDGWHLCLACGMRFVLRVVGGEGDEYERERLKLLRERFPSVIFRWVPFGWTGGTPPNR